MKNYFFIPFVFFLSFLTAKAAHINVPETTVKNWLISLEENNYENYINTFHSCIKAGDDIEDDFFEGVFLSNRAFKMMQQLKTYWSKNGFAGNFTYEWLPLGNDEAPAAWGETLIIARPILVNAAESDEIYEIYLAKDNDNWAILGLRIE